MNSLDGFTLRTILLPQTKVRGIQILKTLGQRIKELRGKKEMTLQEAADKLQCSKQQLSDIENGRRGASEKLLKKIGKLFGDSKLYVRSPTIVSKLVREMPPARLKLVVMLSTASSEKCKRVNEILSESDE